MTQRISIVIITHNEEQNIKECLESAAWANEVIVVDSHSTDRTLEIVKAFTPNAISTAETRYGTKRNIGIGHSVNDWILWLDADERVTPELRNEIQSTLQRSDEAVIGYLIKRKTFFISKFIRHCGWYPDYSLRLLRKSKGVAFDDSRVHEKLIYRGRVPKLENPILHYTDLTFEHYVEKMNKYTSLAALDLRDRNKRTGAMDIIFRPVLTFFKMYFLNLGFLDGFLGLVLCTLSGVSVFTKYSKLYFSQNGKQR